jgi:hypothetical protein
MSLNRGTKLGPYEMLVPIGLGRMGEVYKARDSRVNRSVAKRQALRSGSVSGWDTVPLHDPPDGPAERLRRAAAELPTRGK